MKGTVVVLSVVALALLLVLGYAVVNQDKMVAEDMAHIGSSGTYEGEEGGTETWHHSLSSAMREAQEGNRLVLIDFNATWCPPCKEFAKVTLEDGRVKNKMKGFVFAKIDVDAHREDAVRYQVRVIPTHMIVSADGEVLHREEGMLTPEQYIQFMARAD